MNSHDLPLKFLCSYGGKIIPRQTDGKLRYYGGETRVLSVNRCISFAELLVKVGEMCGTGTSVSLRCQLPNEDLDALVSITSDEDLANLIEEYNGALTPLSSLKIRAFLLQAKSRKKVVSPPPSMASTSSTISNPDATSPNSFCSTVASPPSTIASSRHQNCPGPYKKMIRNSFDQCETHDGRIRKSPVIFHEKVAAKIPQYAYHSRVYLIHHWQ